jgi:hypothetical protein
MMILVYPSKKKLNENMGKRLNYIESSMFGQEYPENGNGKIVGCNRPFSPEYGQSSVRCFDTKIDKKTGELKRIKAKEFFASVTLENHLIVKVE